MDPRGRRSSACDVVAMRCVRASTVLHPPAVDPGITDEERRTVLELIATRVYGAINHKA